VLAIPQEIQINPPGIWSWPRLTHQWHFSVLFYSLEKAGASRGEGLL